MFLTRRRYGATLPRANGFRCAAAPLREKKI
jgi:hypothetical protein